MWLEKDRGKETRSEREMEGEATAVQGQVGNSTCSKNGGKTPGRGFKMNTTLLHYDPKE